LTNSHCTLQLAEAKHKSRGKVGVAGTGKRQWFNHGTIFCCRFAADAANDDSPIQLMIADRGGIYWTAKDRGVS
jgi:hypothetical protein